jgi:NADPH:quinone reductase-like Zn-dependent oxidoreductase
VITWSAADGKTWGSYAEFMRVPVRNVSPMPKSLGFAQAAAVPVASLTAFQALFHAEKGGGMIPGQKMLIHGAAGGVGSFAVQFAKSGGLLVAATCGARNVAYVRSLGAACPLIMRSGGLPRPLSTIENIDVATLALQVFREGIVPPQCPNCLCFPDRVVVEFPILGACAFRR